MFYLSLVKRFSMVLCILSLLFIDAYCITPAKVLKKEVTLQKVKEKTYEEFIRAIAYGSVVKDGKEQIYPKVIVLENKEVQFLDENGIIISQKPLVDWEYIEPERYRTRSALLSKKGYFVGINDFIAKPTDPMPTIVEEEFTIYNDKGEEIYRIRVPVKGMGSTDQWLISDKDGSVVGTRIAYGAIDFYNPDGSIETVPLFGELEWGRREGYATFSSDGEYVAILMREIAEAEGELPSLKADLCVMLFDKSGQELWRKKVDENEIDLYQPEKIAISDHGEYLFFKSFTTDWESSGKEGRLLPSKGESRILTSATLSLYDREGNVLSFEDTSFFNFGGFYFSPQADYVALTGHHIIRLIRTEDGSIVFEKELSDDVAIRQSLFSSDGEYLIVRLKIPVGKEKITVRSGGPREYRTVYGGQVIIFNMKGDQIWKKDFGELKEVLAEKKFLVFSFPYRFEIYVEK
ncbi:MAG: hypothetical protein WBD28_06950 [Candidatus Zixiibacteriota bacterium]